jgi:hypothetical protein
MFANADPLELIRQGPWHCRDGDGRKLISHRIAELCAKNLRSRCKIIVALGHRVSSAGYTLEIRSHDHDVVGEEFAYRGSNGAWNALQPERIEFLHDLTRCHG